MKISKILYTLGCGVLAQSLAMSWDEADAKARNWIKDLTQEEKSFLVTGAENSQGICVGNIKGISRKNFKGLCLQDGPQGVRFGKKSSTSWQAALNSAATFNRELLYEVGKAQGEEFYAKGINIALAPAMNIIRAPAAGRAWENYGEDPFLAGQCAVQVIKGIQDNGVVAAAKHFVANDQEHNREASSSNIDEQAFWEIYLEPFYRSIVDGDVGSFMAAYNAVNGVYIMQNKEILTTILKEKLGFKGFVMSDWWGVHDLENSMPAGLDMNMPGGKAWGPDYINNSFWGANIPAAISSGKVKQSRLDDAALRIIRTLYKFGQMDSYPSVNIQAQSMHSEINRKAAAESNVLLKNQDNILPIKNVKTIAVIGKDALTMKSCTDNGCADGTVAQGWGSGTTDFSYVSEPLGAITTRASKSGIKVVSSKSDGASEGANVAKQADMAIVFVQAHSGEEYITVEQNKGDRNDLDLWHNGNQLVSAVAAANKNTVVVIHGPGAVNLPFLDSVKAVIFAGYPGQETGNAIADVLFGDVNPSGHLPFTWATRDKYCCDVVYPSKLQSGGSQKTQIDYKEGLFVGYRWFDKKGIVPTFPFGHGLSYTTFDYSNLSVSLEKSGTDVTGLKATFTVKNSGSVEGATVPFLFLGFPDVSEMGDYPARVFKGFDKVNLKAGESKTITINVDQHDLSYYSVAKKQFVVPTGGEYTVYVGQSAGNLPLKKAIENTQGSSAGGSQVGGDDCSVDGYKCCSNANAQVVYTDATGKWAIENNEWCIVKDSGSSGETGQCFSIALGFPCCSGTNVIYTDSDGQWGLENGNWCGIGGNSSSASCAVNGYSECTQTNTVVYTDSTGKWGVENSQWCLIC